MTTDYARGGGSSRRVIRAGGSIASKLVLAASKAVLFGMRPFIGNRRYTQRYSSLLRRYGLDIAPYENCGFIATSVNFDSYDYSRMHIGRDVYLTHDVILLVHDQSVVTAYNSALGPNTQPNDGSFYAPADITIGDNVFIGMRSVVLPGTTIGDDVVVGAGSVVRGNLPAGTVWCGNPARQIESTAEYLEKLKRRGALA